MGRKSGALPICIIMGAEYAIEWCRIWRVLMGCYGEVWEDEGCGIV